MDYFQQPIFYALLMCVAGFGIPIMAALNGSLGAKLHSPALATTILFMVGGVVSLANLFLSGGISKFPIQAPTPILFYLGGQCVIFYILSITWVAPKFGVGNAISFVLLGQIISMVVIDYFGLFGALQHLIKSVGLDSIDFDVGFCQKMLCQ